MRSPFLNALIIFVFVTYFYQPTFLLANTLGPDDQECFPVTWVSAWYDRTLSHNYDTGVTSWTGKRDFSLMCVEQEEITACGWCYKVELSRWNGVYWTSAATPTTEDFPVDCGQTSQFTRLTTASGLLLGYDYKIVSKLAQGPCNSAYLTFQNVATHEFTVPESF